MSTLIRVALAVLLTSTLTWAEDLPANIDELFDSPHANTLHCSVEHFDPFLDFTFRYDAGFLVSIPIQQLAPPETLTMYLRATSTGHKPKIFTDKLYVPTIPAEAVKQLGPKGLKNIEARLSAGFAMGDGHYSVDLLLSDEQEHSCQKHWNLKTPHHAQSVPLALRPNTVAAIDADAWDGILNSQGVRLTVLLHVASTNPYASKLYTWDRSLLLQSLVSLLKQLPCRSVQVIAFSLDQQREIFHEEHFDGDGYMRLSETLHKLEFATVSYQALKRGSWQHWLVDFASEQANTQQPSDVVVFLGPNTRFTDKVSSEAFLHPEKAPHFFYFEYYRLGSSQFPDSIDFLTRDMHGTVYKIYSADSLGQAIQKMLDKIKPTQSDLGTPETQSNASKTGN